MCELLDYSTLVQRRDCLLFALDREIFLYGWTPSAFPQGYYFIYLKQVIVVIMVDFSAVFTVPENYFFAEIYHRGFHSYPGKRSLQNTISFAIIFGMHGQPGWRGRYSSGEVDKWGERYFRTAEVNTEIRRRSQETKFRIFNSNLRSVLHVWHAWMLDMEREQRNYSQATVIC